MHHLLEGTSLAFVSDTKQLTTVRNYLKGCADCRERAKPRQTAPAGVGYVLGGGCLQMVLAEHTFALFPVRQRSALTRQPISSTSSWSSKYDGIRSFCGLWTAERANTTGYLLDCPRSRVRFEGTVGGGIPGRQGKQSNTETALEENGRAGKEHGKRYGRVLGMLR